MVCKVRETDQEAKEYSFLNKNRDQQFHTFSSSSLVGDLKALLTAVNHELPPFFPINR
jgi:hypothetical protein